MFYALLKNKDNTDKREEALQALAELRADFAIQHACKGFKINVDEALQLIKNMDDNTLTKEDREKRDRISAAVDNLVEFSVCAEYQLLKKALDLKPGSINFEDEEEMDEYEDLCSKYNKIYAAVENDDIEYAMLMAWQWLRYHENTYLTYWTQNDDRVRPWHYALQGFTAKRDDFPSWMIPPIEWACRCFLISSNDAMGNADIKNIQAKAPKKPKELDGVFSESVCKCGRIFSKSHPYFDVDKADKPMLKRLVKNIMEKYYGEG